MLKSSVHPEGNPHNNDRIDTKSVAFPPFDFSILAACMLLNNRLKQSRSDFAFEQQKLRNSFIFGMLYYCAPCEKVIFTFEGRCITYTVRKSMLDM